MTRYFIKCPIYFLVIAKTFSSKTSHQNTPFDVAEVRLCQPFDHSCNSTALESSSTPLFRFVFVAEDPHIFILLFGGIGCAWHSGQVPPQSSLLEHCWKHLIDKQSIVVTRNIINKKILNNFILLLKILICWNNLRFLLSRFFFKFRSFQIFDFASSFTSLNFQVFLLLKFFLFCGDFFWIARVMMF